MCVMFGIVENDEVSCRNKPGHRMKTRIKDRIEAAKQRDKEGLSEHKKRGRGTLADRIKIDRDRERLSLFSALDTDTE